MRALWGREWARGGLHWKAGPGPKCFQPAFDLHLGGRAGLLVTACFIVRVLRTGAEEVIFDQCKLFDSLWLGASSCPRSKGRITFFFFLLLFWWPRLEAWRILVTSPGIELMSAEVLQWKHGVLTTRPSGNSLDSLFFSEHTLVLWEITPGEINLASLSHLPSR